MEGDIRWVASEVDTYLSYPQLARLGLNRYLLGWGVMRRLDDPLDTDVISYRIPWDYKVMEISEDGTGLTEALLLEGTGWGEQDQMIPLGGGKVAWAYIVDPALNEIGEYPHCNQDARQLSVYVE